MIFRPATPGFLVTLTATIILAVVSFNVPLLKSVFFLKASLSVENINGAITLGTLGYCLELNNGTTCSSPSIGYQFDPNKLLGDNISFAQIPQVVVKWVTYALFLHVIALIAAAISAFFGLLAHVREFSMTCFSSCISGFAATIALVAFIFDIVLFFVVKSRIKGIGGSASLGNAIWLTLAAWILLFFSGCFYSFGRCCISRRPRGPRDAKPDNPLWGRNDEQYAEQMRLDAIKAEADRKARQQKEVGLPAFPEHDVTKPLTHDDDESDTDYVGSLPSANGRNGRGQFRGGYAQAPAGSRAVDEYYSPSRTGYPPQSRQASVHSRSSVYSQQTSRTTTSPPPVPPVPQQNQYLAAGNAGQHSQYPSGRDYGHTAGGTTYHSAVSQPHQQYPSSYSNYNDPYSQPQPQQQQQTPYNDSAYTGYDDPYAAHQGYQANNQTPYSGTHYGYPQTTSPPLPAQQSYAYGSPHATPPPQPVASPYNAPAASSSQAYAQPQPERSYTLGGGGYGENVVPNTSATAAAADSAYTYGYYGAHPSSSPVRQQQQQPPLSQPQPQTAATFDTSQVRGPAGPRSPQGARPRPDVGLAYPPASSAPPQQPQNVSGGYDDAPPGYDAGPSRHAWAEKS